MLAQPRHGLLLGAASALARRLGGVAHDSDDLSVYADIAGTLADHGRLDEAIEWIERLARLR